MHLSRLFLTEPWNQLRAKESSPHKQLVQEMYDRLSADLDEDTVRNRAHDIAPIVVDNDSYNTAIVDYLQTLPVPQNNSFDVPRLVRLCASLARSTVEEVLQELALYLNAVFPYKQHTTKGVQVTKTANVTKK